jgi:hypothetical protein
MSQNAADLVDHTIPHFPGRQWALSLPIPLCALLAAQPKGLIPVLQLVCRVITHHLLGHAGRKVEEVNNCGRTRWRSAGRVT